MALRISIPMPERLTSDVLCAGTHGNYSALYWLNDYSGRQQWAGDKLVAVHIGAPNKGAECDVPVKHSRIGASRLAAALELMLQDKKHAERAGRVIAGSFDAPDADVVLQFAAFGEVIYG